MNPLKNLLVKASVDGISLSCAPQLNDPYLPNVIGEYNRISSINLEVERKKKGHKRDRRCENYKWRFIYQHQASRNLLIVCTKRLFKKSFIPPIHVRFLSSYTSPLSFHEVKDTLNAFRKDHGIEFRVTKLDLAIDLIHPLNIHLHRRVSRSINPLKKRSVKLIKGTDTLVIGALRSPRRLKVYDKGQQLIDKKQTAIQDDISRIEITLRPLALNPPVRNIEGLRKKGWASSLYGSYFTMDHPLPPLKSMLGKRLSSKPIWKQKELLIEKLGKLPDNFCRDFVREHKRFGPAVRKALASFRWI